MDTAWNLCTSNINPIVFTKNSNDGHMTPLMLDALNSSPNSIGKLELNFQSNNHIFIDNENQFMIPQRRASDSYENTYLNGHQYSVQGSTSTPNSVGQSSGTASPDNSTQLVRFLTNFRLISIIFRHQILHRFRSLSTPIP